MLPSLIIGAGTGFIIRGLIRKLDNIKSAKRLKQSVLTYITEDKKDKYILKYKPSVGEFKHILVTDEYYVYEPQLYGVAGNRISGFPRKGYYRQETKVIREYFLNRSESLINADNLNCRFLHYRPKCHLQMEPPLVKEYLKKNFGIGFDYNISPKGNLNIEEYVMPPIVYLYGKNHNNRFHFTDISDDEETLIYEVTHKTYLPYIFVGCSIFVIYIFIQTSFIL